MDKLVDCKRCGGNACYEQTVQDGLKTWMCMGCGFTTSDIMVENLLKFNNCKSTHHLLYFNYEQHKN